MGQGPRTLALRLSQSFVLGELTGRVIIVMVFVEAYVCHADGTYSGLN